MNDTAATDRPARSLKSPVLWVPLAFAAIFFGFFGYALFFGNDSPQQRAIASQMVGEPVPDFALDPAVPGRPGLASTDLVTGEPLLLNVFASWCVPCITESPQLMQLRNAGVRIEAIAVRDRPEDVYGFLQRWGDPFGRIGADPNSQAQLALGSSGVPETFVIDGEGTIVHQHIGEIRPENVPELLNALENAR